MARERVRVRGHAAQALTEQAHSPRIVSLPVFGNHNMRLPSPGGSLPAKRDRNFHPRYAFVVYGCPQCQVIQDGRFTIEAANEIGRPSKERLYVKWDMYWFHCYLE